MFLRKIENGYIKWTPVLGPFLTEPGLSVPRIGGKLQRILFCTRCHNYFERKCRCQQGYRLLRRKLHYEE